MRFTIALLLPTLLALSPLQAAAAAEANADPSITIFGEINATAPTELRAFSFLIGKWSGTGKARAEDGTYTDYKLQWIGRYILNGTAIADEMYATDDKKTLVGLSLRSFDAVKKAWVVEWLNVSGSFLRKQVAPGSGSVTQTPSEVTLNSKGSGALIREHYRLVDADHFVYSMDMSKDDGKNWDTTTVELKMERMKDK